MASQNNVKSIMKKFIEESYLLASRLESLEDGNSFLEKGIIDSTGILEMLEFIEETFTIKIEDEEVIPDNLDSLNKLTVFIETKLKHAGK